MSNPCPCPPKTGQISITPAPSPLLLATVPFLVQRLLQSSGHSCSPSLSLFHIPLEPGKRGELQAASSAWAHHQLTQCQCFLSQPLLLPCSLPTFHLLLSLIQAFWKHRLARLPRFPSWMGNHQSESITGLPVLGLVLMCFPCFPEFPWLPCSATAQGHAASSSLQL